MNSVEQLRYSGRLISIDYLGEDVTDVDTANATVAAYLELLDAPGTRTEAASQVQAAGGVAEAVRARSGAAARR
jgi:proline dehydrogenase